MLRMHQMMDTLYRPPEQAGTQQPEAQVCVVDLMGDRARGLTRMRGTPRRPHPRRPCPTPSRCPTPGAPPPPPPAPPRPRPPAVRLLRPCRVWVWADGRSGRAARAGGHGRRRHAGHVVAAGGPRHAEHDADHDVQPRDHALARCRASLPPLSLSLSSAHAHVRHRATRCCSR
jgi:hypothetical protein